MSRALILDCDGVLADTERDGHLVAFNRAFEEFELPVRWSVEEYGRLLRVGGGKERMIEYFTEHPESLNGAGLAALIPELHRRKSAIYIELVDGGQLPGRPGIDRVVTEALDAGWKVACASTSAERSVEAVLRTAVGPQTRNRIAGVFAGDVVAAKKPAPDIYRLAVRELGVEAKDVIVVEDSQPGAAAATAAGLTHLVTVSGYTRQDAFPDASSVVTSLGDPDNFVELLRGADVRNADGVVDLAGLERLLS